MKSILYDAPIKVESISSDMPKEIHYIINRALAKEPEDRYQSYEEFYNDVKNYNNLKPDESFDADYNHDDMTVLLSGKKKFNVSKPIVISILVTIVFAGLFLIYSLKGTPEKGGEYASNGERFIDEKNYNKAIINLEKVLASDPNDFSAYYLLGIAYQNKGLFDESIAQYKKAIDINQSFAPPYKGLAETYEIKGEIGQAISYNEQYAKLMPHGVDASLIKKKLSELQKNVNLDTEEVKEAGTVTDAQKISKKKDGDVKNDLIKNAYEKGKKLFADKQYAQAIIYFKKVLKDDPGNEDVQRYFKLASHEEKKTKDIALKRSLGIKSYESKNYSQAAIHFNEILNLDPENQNAKKYQTLIRQKEMAVKIEEITKPAAITKRPFYKQTVKILALDFGQAEKFEGIYSINGEKLEQKLKKTKSDNEKSQAVQMFYTQTYSSLRKVLKPDQSNNLDAFIATTKYDNTKVSGSSSSEQTKTDTVKPVGKVQEGSISADSQGTEKKKLAGDDSAVKEEIAKSISLGVKAYDEKKYTQAKIFFNEVLKSDPNNAEAERYLEYINLAKIRMMNDQTKDKVEVDTEKKDTDEANLPEGL